MKNRFANNRVGFFLQLLAASYLMFFVIFLFISWLASQMGVELKEGFAQNSALLCMFLGVIISPLDSKISEHWKKLNKRSSNGR